MRLVALVGALEPVVITRTPNVPRADQLRTFPALTMDEHVAIRYAVNALLARAETLQLSHSRKEALRAGIEELDAAWTRLAARERKGKG